MRSWFWFPSLQEPSGPEQLPGHLGDHAARHRARVGAEEGGGGVLSLTQSSEPGQGPLAHSCPWAAASETPQNRVEAHPVEGPADAPPPPGTTEELDERTRQRCPVLLTCGRSSTAEKGSTQPRGHRQRRAGSTSRQLPCGLPRWNPTPTSSPTPSPLEPHSCPAPAPFCPPCTLDGPGPCPLPLPVPSQSSSGLGHI